MQPPVVSLIIPAYDEETRLEAPLREMASFLAALEVSAEIVVVDDGSRDATRAAVRRIARALPTPLLLAGYARNRGKGHALKVGFSVARGELLVFMDADLATPLDELPRFLSALRQGAAVAIGTRKGPGARVVVQQPRLREWSGRVFTALVRLVILDVSDATCGCKAFRGEVGRDLFRRARLHDWSFDAEVLFLARQAGHEIREIPVRWADRPGSKVSIGADAVRALLGLARIRWHAWLGHYSKPAPQTIEIDLWSSESDGTTGETPVCRRPPPLPRQAPR